MWGVISRHWFLIALVASLAIGFGLTDAVRPFADDPSIRSLITAGVLFLMGLTLPAESIRHNVRYPGPALLAIAVNTFLVPLLALPAMWLLSNDMAGGLIVTALVPSTLASAAVWTRKAGGDDATAMVVSVITNLACFLVVPAGLWLILGRSTEISPMDQVRSLLLWVVIPLLLGQAVRRFTSPRWVTRHRTKLSNAAQVGILLMVCFGSVASADRLATNPSAGGWIEIIAAGSLASAIHLAAFYLGIQAARAIGATPPSQIAVGISGSQKTLMVGLQIGLDFGVSILPMIIYHVSQLMIDTLLVDRWAKAHPQTNPQAAPPTAPPLNSAPKGENPDPKPPGQP